MSRKELETQNHYAIMDRLLRATLAAEELESIVSVSDTDNEDARRESARQKYGLPEGVYLFLADEGGMTSREARSLEPFVKKWVRGTLTKERAAEVLVNLDCFFEVDFGYAFLDEPLYFYAAKFDSARQRVAMDRFLIHASRNSK